MRCWVGYLIHLGTPGPSRPWAGVFSFSRYCRKRLVHLFLYPFFSPGPAEFGFQRQDPFLLLGASAFVDLIAYACFPASGPVLGEGAQSLCRRFAGTGLFPSVSLNSAGNRHDFPYFDSSVSWRAALRLALSLCIFFFFHFPADPC